MNDIVVTRKLYWSNWKGVKFRIFCFPLNRLLEQENLEKALEV